MENKEIMRTFLKDIKGLKIPSRAHDTDAGYDIIATSDPIIIGESIERPLDFAKCWKRIDFIEYETNLFYAPESESVHTLVFPRSSISKYNLTLANSIALIDNSYRGHVLLRFRYHFQPEDLITIPEAGVNKIYGFLKSDKIYRRGDKVAQLVLADTHKIDFELVAQLPESTRGSNGFGSSGH